MTPRPYIFSSLGFTAALLITTAFYFRQHPTDTWLIWAALPAFLIEGLCYLGATLACPRQAFARLPMKATLLWISSLIPYLMFSVPAHMFQLNAFLLLAGLTAGLCYWNAVLPRRLIYDFGFLVIAAAPIVARVFRRIYISPDPHISIDILGHMMWLRTGIVALLVLRQWDPGAFGLWPDWREWKNGLTYFAISILPVCLLATAVGDVRFAPTQKPLWLVAAAALGTFFGILWVVALGEELLFRGILARLIADASGNQAAAVVLSALLFGSAHLWYHAYPNWRRALVATLIGLFCGTLYLRTGSVRAPMVTHSLIVVTWRFLFTT